MEKKPIKARHVFLLGVLTLVWIFLALWDFHTGAGMVSKILSVFCVLCWLAAFVCCLLEYKKQT